MRRVGRSGTGWLGVEGLQDEVKVHLWSIARRAAQDAGRDPDALKTATRLNLEPGMPLTLDQLLDFASQVIEEPIGSGSYESLTAR